MEKNNVMSNNQIADQIIAERLREQNRVNLLVSYIAPNDRRHLFVYLWEGRNQAGVADNELMWIVFENIIQSPGWATAFLAWLERNGFSIQEKNDVFVEYTEYRQQLAKRVSNAVNLLWGDWFRQNGDEFTEIKNGLSA